MRRLLLFLCTVGVCVGQQNPETGRLPAAALTEIQELMQGGDYRKAKERLTAGPSTDPFVLRLLLELAERSGARDEAEGLSRRLLQLFDSGRLATPDEIAQAAYGAARLDLWQDANRLFIEATKKGAGSVSLYVDWGNLYLRKYNAAEAEAIFQDGIKSASAASDYSRWGQDSSYVGLSRSLEDQFKGGASEALDKALELNPENLEAISLKGLQGIKEDNFGEAESWIKKGLEINKNHVPLLELKSALQYFSGEMSDYEKTQRQVLEMKPNDADLFETLGDIAVRKRRLDEATEFYREAVRKNPQQWSALASLGINLLRLAKEDEGKQVLERAYANDPFNIWTVNTLRLLDSFDRFVRFETSRFRVRLHEEEAAVMRPYVENLLEKSLQTLEQKYNHRVEGTQVFEMYPDHADFAVRTLGLPGLGALGATFGRTVAMDSPSARTKGEFHWGSTLWHEIAHVVTLSLSDGKVPRWLTEGISMMEERQAGEGWGDNLNVGFVRAYEKGDLLSLGELNAGFERPKSGQQVALSYFQAGWVCEFLVSRYGFEKLRAMVAAFAEGLTTEQVFEKVLQASVEEVDEEFRKELDETLKPLTSHLKEPSPPPSPAPSILIQPRGEPTEANAEEAQQHVHDLVRAVETDSENYFLNFRAGHALKEVGREEEAIFYLEKSIQVFPTSAGQGSPYSLLAEIYDKLSLTDQALDLRRRWWRMAPRFSDNARRLADLLSEKELNQEAAEVLESAMYGDPLETGLHEKLGEVYMQTQEPERAVAEFEMVLAMEPADQATAHYRLAHALLDSGDSGRARRHVLMSLEIAPGYEEAQKLLLRVARR